MGSEVVGARGALDGASSGAGRCEFAPVGVGVTWGLGWAYLATEGGEGGEKEGGGFLTRWEDGVTALERPNWFHGPSFSVPRDVDFR